MIYPVILSGGSGSRLWPLSREHSPKQFISLINNKNLLQNTCLRFVGLEKFKNPTIICNEAHRFQVAESMRDINVTALRIILEPIARNTAPAIALAAFAVLEMDPEAIMLVLPADHYIDSSTELINSIVAASESDYIEDYLFTFGIKPRQPETGYGYIKVGEELEKNIKKVHSFVEKPDLDNAKQYVASNEYYWNSGIFLLKAKKYLEELQKFQLEMYKVCKRAYELKRQDLDFVRIDRSAFQESPSESIDYAILEKTKNIAVILLEDLVWSDIGSWGALFDLEKKDENGNVLKGDIVCESITNCYLQSYDRLLAAVGINDIVVIETADAILITNKHNTQEVKQIIKKLQHNNREEIIRHKKHYSPWGYSVELNRGQGFIVKHLQFVKEGKTSSHQHFHRDEHIAILAGEARLVFNEDDVVLKKGDSFVINSGIMHQIINIGDSPLDIIEIWLGVQLEELDILRIGEVC